MKKWIVLWTLGLFFITTQQSHAEKYLWGVEDLQYFPLYSSEGETYLGYASDLFNLFEKTEKLEMEIKPFPVKRLYDNFFAGKIDFKFPDHPNWQTDLRKDIQIIYSDPVIDYIDGCMVLPAKVGKGLSSIKVLGTVRGFTAWDYLDQIKSGSIKVSENNSFTGLLQQVIMGRVDCAYINITVARYQLNEILKKPGGAVFDPSLPHTSDSYKISSKKHPEVIEKFNKFLNGHAGEIAVLKAKYNISP
ncbi:MAG: transporter substrate-binding domain-containing protein [SAR324 cluster bacterium]|nr:transporter substrate-binding domain-containing protein [SAR324 cluster bacterium]